MIHRAPTRLIAPLLAALLLAAVAPGPALAATTTIKMDNAYAYHPATVTVQDVGDLVVWKNVQSSSTAHDVYSGLSGYFNSGGPESIEPGHSYGRVFVSAGTFAYGCSVHIGMTGTVIVPISVALVNEGSQLRVTVGSKRLKAASPYRNVIQVRKPGASGYTTVTTTTAASVLFTPHKHGTFRFRAAVRRTSNGERSDWSPSVSRTW